MIRRATIPKMNRFLLPILFTVLLVFAIVFDAMAENCDSDLVVSWTPLEIITAGMPGETIEKSADFKLVGKGKKINTKFWMSSELGPFVLIHPESIKNTIIGNVYSIGISLSIPSDTSPGKYEGSLYLQIWNKPSKSWETICPGLSVKLTVTGSQNPLSILHSNRYPTRIAQGGPGDKFYVSDAEVGSVFIYNFNSSSSTFALVGELKNLATPLGVAVDGTGNIYVGNNGRDNVEVYRADGSLKSTIGGIQMPNDMALDSAGNLYVVDSLSHMVKVYDSSGQWLRNIGGPGNAEGELKFPVAVTIHYSVQGTGEIYVADQGHYKVQVFGLEGTFLRSFGGKVYAGGMMGNTWYWKGLFLKLQSLAVDNQGFLHAADCLMNNVQILNVDTGSYEDSYGTFGTGTGELNLPLDLFITNDGKVIVTNAGNHRVEIIHTITAP